MVNKTTSIKQATDQELDALLTRLRKEAELQSVIRELAYRALPEEQRRYSSIAVSTEAPIDSLYHNTKVEETLAHYGILGMKWGVRRPVGPDGRVSSYGKAKPVADDYKRIREAKAKGYKNLSTKELQEITQRLQLEKQLRELTVSDYSKGMEVAKGVLTAGTTVASIYALIHTPLGKAIQDSLAKK